MEPNTAVLLIAHGSRESRANEELHDTANRLELALAEETKVFPCFLEIERPSIGEAFRQAVTGGASAIIAFPFFLSSGVHVLRDIPSILRGCLQEFPQISVSITSSLGPDPRLDQLILERLSEGGEKLDPDSETTDP